tara:strand:+ start:1168 stop:1692 length:525 start_codon:yes stop_codon:yes gene_type:complete
MSTATQGPKIGKKKADDLLKYILLQDSEDPLVYAFLMDIDPAIALLFQKDKLNKRNGKKMLLPLLAMRHSNDAALLTYAAAISEESEDLDFLPLYLAAKGVGNPGTNQINNALAFILMNSRNKVPSRQKKIRRTRGRSRKSRNSRKSKRKRGERRRNRGRNGRNTSRHRTASRG